MSERYPGGILSKAAPAVGSNVASGVWTMEQQAEYAKAGTWPTAPVYVEEVFNTYLYTGNGNAGLTINNSIDLSGKGGLTWLKKRSAAGDNYLYDTARGASSALISNTTAAASNDAALNGFTSTGFTLSGGTLGDTYTSWTFRKQPKFFDVVTWTGDGTGIRAINHSLASVPGCMIIKRTDTSMNWYVYHRSLTTPNVDPVNNVLILNTTAAGTSAAAWGALPTSTTLTVASGFNVSGATYVVYLFAHNAGGFGMTGADNVISCGSYTGNGSSNGPSITLGYEPQWLLVKKASTTGNWYLTDNMRGMATEANEWLLPNLADAASPVVGLVYPTATGFKVNTTGGEYNTSGETYIYIAIRRGPMKTPTSGTSVFTPALASSSGTYTATSNFPVDWAIEGGRSGSAKFYAGTRLIGDATLQPNTTGAESAQSWGFDNMTGFTLPGVAGDYSGFINWMFRRAPGFFDEVCFTADGSGNYSGSHNLGVSPELVITRCRSTTGNWFVWTSLYGSTKTYQYLNLTNEKLNFPVDWISTSSTALAYLNGAQNASQTYVAYLFASCPGVSKVGSYTGTGTTKQIDCGFTGGARFVLIKRTDSTGDWYVWDSARGIVAGNDPYLLLNSTAAEVTNTDYVDTYSAGFEISSTAPAAINASGGSYIYLAIA